MEAQLSRILLVDDEPQILRVLRMPLQSSGFEVVTASDGIEGLHKFETMKPDLMITDLSMPLMDGLELTKAVRAISEIPIIVLSVRSAENMKVQALDFGADDYLSKPFSTPELLARVRAQLRRLKSTAADTRYHVGDFEIAETSRTVTIRAQEIHLTPKEFDLLLAFARRPDRTLTHDTLLRIVWGSSSGHQAENLRVLVASLRKKIEASPGQRYIESEPWVGYRFWPKGHPELGNQRPE